MAKKNNKKTKKQNVPCVPLRDIIVFPHMIVPLLVGRTLSLNAAEEALTREENIVISFQKNPHVEKPKFEDIYSIGVLAKITQSVKESSGIMKILVEVMHRVKIKKIVSNERFFACDFEEIAQQNIKKNKETEALKRFTLELLEKYTSLNNSVPDELTVTVAGIEDPSRLCDTIAGYLPLKVKDKATLIETVPVKQRLQLLIDILNNEISVLEVQKKIQSKVVKKIEKTQRQYFLNEQLKEIKKELGKEGESPEINMLRERIKKAQMSEEARNKAYEELARLSKMMPLSPEANVVQTYLEWLINLPWKTSTKDYLQIKRAKKILEEDHYGLQEVKERILEYLAVRKRTKSLKGPILCFVGPPGVGKTSLGRSIARAMSRKFVRISLGGMRDEAEIKGHRRTYIGALPGRIIHSLKKAGVNNPVFLLDEVDKLGKDFRGDPASALLEVLDPEQNNSFSDHYLEVDFDLSRILFITTANTDFTIPPALLDRMEIISLPGYTVWEKQKIARQFLIPKQMKEHNLTGKDIEISDEALEKIIRIYTREAGVRNLEREIAKLCRKVTLSIVESKKKQKKYITLKNLEKYLGPEKYNISEVEKEPNVGVATGMAWTEYGGEIIFTEALTMKGKGNLNLTGKLGEVMKESAKASLSYVRSNAEELGINPDFYKELDVHIHVPEGAIPKDGPSAGVTIVTALTSCLSKKPVDPYVAMTGEITLRGKVLKIGGLKGKILAAHRSGIKKVIIPEENKKELKQIPKKIKQELEIIPVREIKEVLKHAILNDKEEK
jgi:ATP-dependent Lon protease